MEVGYPSFCLKKYNGRRALSVDALKTLQILFEPVSEARGTIEMFSRDRYLTGLYSSADGRDIITFNLKGQDYTGAIYLPQNGKRRGILKDVSLEHTENLESIGKLHEKKLEGRAVSTKRDLVEQAGRRLSLIINTVNSYQFR